MARHENRKVHGTPCQLCESGIPHAAPRSAEERNNGRSPPHLCGAQRVECRAPYGWDCETGRAYENAPDRDATEEGNAWNRERAEVVRETEDAREARDENEQAVYQAARDAGFNPRAALVFTREVAETARVCGWGSAIRLARFVIGNLSK